MKGRDNAGRRCVVHIGMNKTGSSSIQSTMRTNARHLVEQHRVEYYTGLVQHSLIAGFFMDDPLEYAAIVRQVDHRREVVDAWVATERRRLEDTIGDRSTPTFVLSGEGLSTMAEPEVGAMHRFLSDRFDEIDIYMYVRDPFSYAMSKAAQNIKSGVSFEEMRAANLDEPMEGPRMPAGDFSPAIQPFYRQRIEPYRSAFGTDHVHLRQWDPNKFAGGDVIVDWLSWAFDIDATDAIEVRRVNESIDGRSLALIEAANRTVPLFDGHVRNPGRAQSLVRLLSTDDGAPFVFPDFDADRFADVVREDVAWLARATGGTIDFDPSPPTPSDTAQPFPPPDSLAQRINDRMLIAERDRRLAHVLELALRATTASAAGTRDADRLRAACDELDDPDIAARVLALVDRVGSD